jgi:hypothetical protein
VERVPFTFVIVEPHHVGKNVLLPASTEAQLVLQRLGVEEQVGVEIYRERRTKFDTHVHMLFERIAQALGHRTRNVRGWIAAQTGRADLVMLSGKLVCVAHGTGSRDMRADQFAAFWLDAKEVVISEIMPTLPASDRVDIGIMIRRIEEMEAPMS